MANERPVSNAPKGIELYLKRVFTLMFGAVALSAIVSFLTLQFGWWQILYTEHGVSPIYYVLTFGTFIFSIWAQSRTFSMKPQTGALFLFVYSALIGFLMTPLIGFALYNNPASILQAFVISSLMFGCMALFGYKTMKDLSFLRVFLFLGMIGLVLVGIISMIWPLGGVFATLVSALGVLIFALFTAYDMQFQKKAYSYMQDETQKNQLAVLGALHLYIAFIAMFQYVLDLLNRIVK